MSDVRIAQLLAKIAAREGKTGYARNVSALKSELAKLQVSKAIAAVSPATDPNDSGEPDTGLTADEPAA